MVALTLYYYCGIIILWKVPCYQETVTVVTRKEKGGNMFSKMVKVVSVLFLAVFFMLGIGEASAVTHPKNQCDHMEWIRVANSIYIQVKKQEAALRDVGSSGPSAQLVHDKELSGVPAPLQGVEAEKFVRSLVESSSQFQSVEHGYTKVQIKNAISSIDKQGYLVSQIVCFHPSDVVATYEVLTKEFGHTVHHISGQKVTNLNQIFNLPDQNMFRIVYSK